MPSENTSRTITSIKLLKKVVRVYFDERMMELTPDRFTDQYLYVGKTINETDFENLKSVAALCKLENYARGLLMKGPYTRKVIAIKLYAKGAKRHQVEDILQDLTKKGLLDDATYMEDRIAYGHARLQGYHAIYDDLVHKGVSAELLEKFKFDYDLELQKAKMILPRLQKAHLSKSHLAQHRFFYEWYLSHGFAKDVITPLIETLEHYSLSQEHENLQKELENGKRKFAHKYHGKKLRQRLFQYLAQKGYNYAHISEALGALEDEMD